MVVQAHDGGEATGFQFKASMSYKVKDCFKNKGKQNKTKNPNETNKFSVYAVGHLHQGPPLLEGPVVSLLPGLIAQADCISSYRGPIAHTQTIRIHFHLELGAWIGRVLA